MILNHQFRRRGFTLIELLTVIAVIGILAAIIIPTASTVRVTARKAKTKTQLTQIASAFELFKQDYGYYPIVPENKLNGSLARNATSVAAPARQMLMLELLTGKDADPSSANFESDEKNLSSGTPRAQNKKRVQFYNFSNEEVLSFSGSQKAIIDPFGNIEIVALVDRNGDGMITTDEPADTNGDGEIGSSENLSGFPDVYATQNPANHVSGTAIRDAKLTLVSGTRYSVRASVVLYSAGLGDKADPSSKEIQPSEAVFTW